MSNTNYVEVKNHDTNTTLSDDQVKKVMIISSASLVTGVMFFLWLFTLIG